MIFKILIQKKTNLKKKLKKSTHGLIGTGRYPSVPGGGLAKAAILAWTSQYNLLLTL